MGAPRPSAIGRWRLAAIMVGVAIVGLVPLLVTDRYLLRIFTLVGINLIVVIGLSLLFGYTGQVSLGHASFVGLGAYGSAFAAMRGVPWVLALVLGVALACVGGLVLAMPSLRLKGHYLAMATLGFCEIMFVFFDNAEPLTGGSDGLQGIPPASIGPLQITTAEGNYWLVWGFACLVLILAANVVPRRPGRALRAIHGSEAGAQACGVDTIRAKIQVFVVSAGLAGLAGALGAHYIGSISPASFTLHRSIVFLAMVALGGAGSLSGSVAAVLFLTLLPYIDAIVPGLPRSTAQVLQNWEPDIYGAALILVMLFLPRGISGLARDAVGRVRALAARSGASGEGERP